MPICANVIKVWPPKSKQITAYKLFIQFVCQCWSNTKVRLQNCTFQSFFRKPSGLKSTLTYNHYLIIAHLQTSYFINNFINWFKSFQFTNSMWIWMQLYKDLYVREQSSKPCLITRFTRLSNSFSYVDMVAHYEPLHNKFGLYMTSRKSKDFKNG